MISPALRSSIEWDDDVEDYLRGRQVHAAEQNVSRGLIGFTVAAAFALFFFYSSYPTFSVSWFALVLGTSGLRIAAARKTQYETAPAAFAP